MLLLGTDPVFAEHDPGPGHPERIARLRAVHEGVVRSRLGDAIARLDTRDATRAELERVHDPATLHRIEHAVQAGGGSLDVDTVVSPGSWRAAVRAAGTGIAAVEALERGEGTAAFLALRPPGHHATSKRAMGFCLVNNVAVVAAALVERGERVCIIDYDAHHGNGTQEIFYDDDRVLYVSLHEFPLYPGTGRLDERGRGDAVGSTCNIPLPAGTTGDVYLLAFDEVVEPLVERFAPSWVLASVGFDAHRADPLTGLALSAGDFGLIARRLARIAPRSGRLIAFLEGGYDLDAIADSVAATLPALVSVATGGHEQPTTGGPGRDVVEAASMLWAEHP